MSQAQVIVMTPDQLKEFAFSVIDEYENRKSDINKDETNPNEVVYGIRGIMGLFNVSINTAQRYKATFLKEAVSQRGRKIITNVALAKKLFNETNNK